MNLRSYTYSTLGLDPQTPEDPEGAITVSLTWHGPLYLPAACLHTHFIPLHTSSRTCIWDMAPFLSRIALCYF